MQKDTFMGKSIYPTGPRAKVPQGAKVYPIKNGKARLQTVAFGDVVPMIKEMVRLPQDLFANGYVQLIENYADFVQLIPEREDVPGQTMLANSLKRAFEMTREFIHQMQAVEGESFYQSERGARLVYAVFSSALLFRVAKIFSDKQIFLCNDKGILIKSWLYFSKPMSRYGSYFKMRMTPTLSDDVVAHMTVVLAKQIMPTIAFAWITEDKGILETWFRALNIMDEFFGVHQMDLNVDALIRASRLSIDVEEDFFVSKEVMDGEGFWQWLLEKIDASGTDAAVEKDGFGLVDGELLFDVDLIGQYAKSHGVSTNVVADQLKAIGVVRSQGGDLQFLHLQSKSVHNTGVAGTGLYAQKSSHVDAMDAKKFVGIDATVARACIKGYNGLRNSDSHSLGNIDQSIFSRLTSVFLGNLNEGIDMINGSSGGGV